MAKLNLERTRKLLQAFDLTRLFTEELGWNNPPTRQADVYDVDGEQLTCRPIAQLAGVMVYEVSAAAGQVPDSRVRALLHTQVERRQFENLLIFVDAARATSLWYWVKREGAHKFPRSHFYAKAQPGDLFLSKLSNMVVDISELDANGNLPISDVAGRLRNALDVERVTKGFYTDFDLLRVGFTEQIKGISNEHDRRWYASVLLNRLMFVYFLQRKFFLDNGDADYLQNRLSASKAAGKDQYYSGFLKTLFFEGFAKPEAERDAATNRLIGQIRYLNGGLFLEHDVEQRYAGKISIADAALEKVLDLFAHYSWNLNDTPGGADNEINPDVLGYIFEKYINQKEFGAYYTRPQITEYLCAQTIHQLILDGVNTTNPSGLRDPKGFESVDDLLLALDAPLCRRLLNDVLPRLSLLDPACGSGAFLVAAMKTLIAIYTVVIARAREFKDTNLKVTLDKMLAGHPNAEYAIKKAIITNNLFGVDIMDEAVEIARLRLFLALVASADTASQLEPLPNIDFNILGGNSLIGLLRVDEAAFNAHQKPPAMQQLTMGLTTTPRTYAEILEDKRRLIASYRANAVYGEHLQQLRNDIQTKRHEAYAHLNALQLETMSALGVQYQQATWDDAAGEEGRPKKRALSIADVVALKPFHWGYEFDEVMNTRGGFDAIITNPPWETFKPQAKEFFTEYSEIVTKNAMTIKDFEKEQARLLKQPDVRRAWLAYLSRFPHVSAYYRSAPQYANQISVVNGKKAGSDINLYKLFTEQCYNLLRDGGRCGIIIPSGIYTDLGSKQLRELLFSQARIQALFGLSNERYIFEGVHHAFKICILAFEKGGSTPSFPSAFRINTREAVSAEELDDFFNMPARHLHVSTKLIRRLSPDSLSVMEFKSEMDVRIAEKMLRFPLLGEHIEGVWNVELSREFDMTQGDASTLVRTSAHSGFVPLFEGKMIWHFDHRYADAKYWVKPNELRRHLLGKTKDIGQMMSYQSYRLAFRRQASSTNERTLVSTVIPPTFHADNLASIAVFNASHERQITSIDQIFVAAFLNSFVLDYSVRQRVTTNLNFFYIYQLPVPRLTAKDAAFAPIVERAARLICTTPEFDALAAEVAAQVTGNSEVPVTWSTSHPVTLNPAERARLRAELDGLIAHLYGLTEEEFAHVLAAFPLVEQSVKDAAMEEFRKRG